jgi:hypothetical protein
VYGSLRGGSSHNLSGKTTAPMRTSTVREMYRCLHQLKQVLLETLKDSAVRSHAATALVVACA